MDRKNISNFMARFGEITVKNLEMGQIISKQLVTI